MALAFTIDATNWQQKAEELRLAYSERSAVYANVNYNAVGPYKRFEFSGTEWAWVTGDGTDADKLETRTAEEQIAAGVDEADVQPVANLQSVAFWRGMQDFITTYGTRATNLDLTYPASDGTISEMVINYLQRYGYDDALKEFYRNAITPETTDTPLFGAEDDYGFRRAYELDGNGDPVMTRGKIQEGDIIGEWVFEDLVAAFYHMQYRGHWLSIDTDAVEWNRSTYVAWPTGGVPDIETAKANAWATASTTPVAATDSIPYQGYAIALNGGTGSGSGFVGALVLRKEGGLVLPGAMPDLPNAAGWYAATYDYGWNTIYGTPAIQSSNWSVDQETLIDMTAQFESAATFPASAPAWDAVYNNMVYVSAVIKFDFTNGPVE